MDLSGLRHALDTALVGQKTAKQTIVSTLQAHRISGLFGDYFTFKPPVYLFLGPTGVGKSLMAKSLADFFFGPEDKEKLTIFDMTNFSESFNVSRLIGAPPGYEGGDRVGELATALQQNPGGFILFDEIEKAHLDVFKVLLPLFDEGRMQTNAGEMVQADNSSAVFMLTSNAGSQQVVDLCERGVDPLKMKTTLADTLIREYGIAPELLGRIDYIIPFMPLGKEVMRSLVERKVQAFLREQKRKNHIIKVAPSALDALVLLSTEGRAGGVREFHRIVGQHLSPLLLSEMNVLLSNSEVRATISWDTERKFIFQIN